MFDESSLPLILGTVLALVALSYVLLPLLNSVEQSEHADAPVQHATSLRTEPRESLSDESGMAVAALREIEFDRETGKLSEGDYAELKTKYTALALAELRRQDNASLAAGISAHAPETDEDPVEAAVRAVQARRPKCVTCGPRPESDSIYCSNCGTYLPGSCGSCGAAVTQPGARFCNSCGGSLAAA